MLKWNAVTLVCAIGILEHVFVLPSSREVLANIIHAA